jgi:hemin uptake protein HemP
MTTVPVLVVNTAAGEDDPRNVGSLPSAAAPERRIPLTGDRIDSRDLFVGTREIIITHGGELYRLRLTAQNKLILTK